MWNLWMQRLVHSQLQATFLHSIQRAIMSYKIDQRDTSVNGNKWNLYFEVILEARTWKNFCFPSSPTSGIRSWVTTIRKSGKKMYVQLIGRLKILWLNTYTDTYKHLHSHKLKCLKFNTKGGFCKKKNHMSSNICQILEKENNCTNYTLKILLFKTWKESHKKELKCNLN